MRNENSEVKKSPIETLENNLALVAEDKEWFEVFDNKKELLDVLQKMEEQIQNGEEINNVALNEVLNDFEDMLESGNELISIDAEI